VEAARLLDALTDIIGKAAWLPSGAPETLALWVLHTYVYTSRAAATYIGIESPTRRCGKTTLLNALAALVSSPVVAANISPPAFYRVIQQLQPTLLIDEADTVLRGNSELRGILNAGYRNDTAYVIRIARQRSQQRPQDCSAPVPAAEPLPVRFSTWCPKAIAAIGSLPPTLSDRCITIRMERRPPTAPRPFLCVEAAATATRQCRRFALDQAQAVAAAVIAPVPTLNDREQEIWDPLFAVAHVAGGAWPAMAAPAAQTLSAQARFDNPSAALLLDLVSVFDSSGHEKLSTTQITAALRALPSRSSEVGRVTPQAAPKASPRRACAPSPWGTVATQCNLGDRQLAALLAPFGIRPRNIRIAGQVLKGYARSDFERAIEGLRLPG